MTHRWSMYYVPSKGGDAVSAINHLGTWTVPLHGLKETQNVWTSRELTECCPLGRCCRRGLYELMNCQGLRRRFKSHSNTHDEWFTYVLAWPLQMPFIGPAFEEQHPLKGCHRSQLPVSPAALQRTLLAWTSEYQSRLLVQVNFRTS